ncbi:MAG TPA: Gfo/Idh/MocA family oxidoreductase [Clostridiales bacterium]|nr:Gfo/Idh/MocA family oxidoreductase [Clostridiales bacterium]
MNQYKAALVGYGGMGRWHKTGICKTDRILITGAYDINPERMEQARQDGLKTYESYEALLADREIDIVIVATPNNFHLPQSCQAMEAGKFVVCEKPVTMSSDELQEMMDCSKRTGTKFTIHQNRRKDADYLAMRDVVEKGLLGEVFQIESRVTGSRGIPEGWRQYRVAGGGMMLDWGVHLIDQMVMMMSPAKVTDVYCELYNVNYKECDDGFKLIMHFENGPSVMVEVGTSHFISAPRWYVCGNRGALIIPNWDCNGKIIRASEHEVRWEEEIIYTKAGPTKTMAPRAKDTIEEIAIDGDKWNSDYDYFYRNLADYLDGNAELTVKPEEAMRVMKIMEAAFESHYTRSVIKCNI